AQVDAGVDMVHRTQDAIGGIVRQVSEINDVIANIARDAGDHVRQIDRVTAELGSVDEAMNSGANLAHEAGETADELQTVIVELGRTVREFRIERQNRHQETFRPATNDRSPPARVPLLPV